MSISKPPTMKEVAHLAGVSVQTVSAVVNAHDDVQLEVNYIQTITQRWIDGVLLVPTGEHIAGLEGLRIAGIPVVVIDHIPETYNGAWVAVDNRLAGQMAANHLIDLGHTRLAHIGGPPSLRLARDRELGFRRAIEAKGLSPVACVAAQSWTCEGGNQAMRQLLAASLPTGIFCASDRIAIGAMLAIREAGLKTPGDISIIGMDDIEMVAFHNPALTTIRQSFSRLGTLAVELLLAVMEGREPDQKQLMLEPTLIQRASTAKFQGE